MATSSAMKASAGTFKVVFSGFGDGAAPLAHLDSLTELGTGGSYSAAGNVDIISLPGKLQQGPGLATLTNGDQGGVVSELILHIADRPVSSGTTYGIGATKLFQISATAVASGGSPSWPYTITGASGGGGNSVAYFQGKLYYFFNKASGADCGTYDLSSTFVDNYMSTTPTGAAALQNAPHPVATKQDVMLFGNGQYVGVFFSANTLLNDKRLDFGAGATIADICFDANAWWICVNVGTGVSTDRQYASIYQYDASATTALLTDEIAVGAQKIGFIIPIEGVRYVAYQDLTTAGGFAIGYIKGRGITPLKYFTGTLPTFAQKSLYLNTIIFLSSNLVYSCGAVEEKLPVQISQLASGGYSTVGAIACPFGTPMIASTDGGSNFKLAKFSGLTVSCTWRSLVIPTINENYKGYIDKIVVLTKTLGTSARCDLIIEGDQASKTGTTQQITTSGKRRHTFNSLGLTSLEDFRIFLNWANGDTTNNVSIRQIQVMGHYVEQK